MLQNTQFYTNNNNINNNNTSICKAHNVSIRAESEAPTTVIKEKTDFSTIIGARFL